MTNGGRRKAQRRKSQWRKAQVEKSPVGENPSGEKPSINTYDINDLILNYCKNTGVYILKFHGIWPFEIIFLFTNNEFFYENLKSIKFKMDKAIKKMQSEHATAKITAIKT